MTQSPKDNEADVPVSTAAFVEAPTDPQVSAKSGSNPPSRPLPRDEVDETVTSAGPLPEVDPLDKAKKEYAELKDKYLRMAADYDNHRKRTRKEVEDAEKKGRESLLKELLPVFDNLELAVRHSENATEVKAVSDGVRMVLRQFLDTLDRANIKRVDTKGAFDPMVHEAIQQMETDEQPPGAIVAEVQAGYQMGEKLVRAALVVVAKAKSSSGGAPS